MPNFLYEEPADPPADIRTFPLAHAAAQREVTLAVAGAVRTYKVADATAPNGQRTRVQGVLQPTRRQPTPEEIQRINDHLAALSQQLDAQRTMSRAQADVTTPPT